MNTSVCRRVARKAHRCYGCDGPIPAGDVYLRLVVFPGHDVIDVDRPWAAQECARCAARRGRDDHLGDVPWEQAARLGLL